MTEVLTLMLLVYPGALMDLFYKKLAFDRYDDHGDSDIMKMAIYFVWSGVIAVISLGIMSLMGIGINPGVYGALEALKTGWNCVIYVIIATGLCLVAAFLRIRGLDRVRSKYFSAYPSSLQYLVSRDAWQEIMHSDRYDWEDVICTIFKDNEFVTGGIASHLPDDIIRKPSLALDYVDFVVGTYSDDDNRELYFDHLMVEFFMMDTGYSIKFFKAPALMEYLSQYSSSEAGGGVFVLGSTFTFVFGFMP